MAGKNPSSDLKQLQLNLKNIRNICILAHVDHGRHIWLVIIIIVIMIMLLLLSLLLLLFHR